MAASRIVVKRIFILSLICFLVFIYRQVRLLTPEQITKVLGTTILCSAASAIMMFSGLILV